MGTAHQWLLAGVISPGQRAFNRATEQAGVVQEGDEPWSGGERADRPYSGCQETAGSDAGSGDMSPEPASDPMLLWNGTLAYATAEATLTTYCKRLANEVAPHGIRISTPGKSPREPAAAPGRKRPSPSGFPTRDVQDSANLRGSGFDFLGFNVRRYHGKLLIKPSVAAQRRIRERLSTEMLALRGANTGAVLKKINPIVRGWSAYYRTVVSSEVFTALDNHVWKLAYKWAKHSHPNKPKHWICDKYFGRFNKARKDRWVFGDRASGAYLLKFSWTKIVRHQLVKGRASPDDPALESYWAERRRKGPTPPVDGITVRLLQAQRGRCSICGGLLLHADHPPQSPQEWEAWRVVVRKAISKQYVAFPGGDSPGDQRLRLLHTLCQRRTGAAGPTNPAPSPDREPLGLA
ncbi:group II intron maturase-specific domain-containing protein [Streptomyces sp. NPDC091217]|uniref:group II intron maturase-specific domain-containing protein n=1 Tax=Streptomyces sp. NPDC091217 TaxID=3365975 RepID=UPI00381689E9